MRHIAACDRLPQVEVLYYDEAMDRLPGNCLTSSLSVVISGSGREDRLISSMLLLLIRHFIRRNDSSESG
jgi:hypothetical protein